MTRENSQQIAQTFQVMADQVLSGGFDLAGYPHRYLVVAATRGFWHVRLAAALAAAETLIPAGFQLVNTIEFREGNAVCAVLRR